MAVHFYVTTSVTKGNTRFKCYRGFFTFSIGFKNVSRKQEFHKRNRSLPDKLK